MKKCIEKREITRNTTFGKSSEKGIWKQFARKYFELKKFISQKCQNIGLDHWLEHCVSIWMMNKLDGRAHFHPMCTFIQNGFIQSTLSSKTVSFMVHFRNTLVHNQFHPKIERPRKVRARRVGPRRVGALKGGEPKISRFFPSFATMFILSSLSRGVFSWNCGRTLTARLGFSGHFV